MISQQKDAAASVQAKIEIIVAEGKDVRSQVADVVTGGAESFHLDKQGLLALSRSVLDGAAVALDKAVPRDAESVLRQVVDGLGDGLSTAALASRLAMEEAGTQEQRFADEDLTQLAKDLRTIGDLFVDTVTHAAGKFKSMSQAQVSALGNHAEQTRRRLLPAIESALVTIKDHPIRFAKESLEAGVRATKQALGSLFAAVGRRMDEAGKRLAGEGSDK